MGESGRGFGLEFMRKQKKGKSLNMMVPNFLYTHSISDYYINAMFYLFIIYLQFQKIFKFNDQHKSLFLDFSE